MWRVCMCAHAHTHTQEASSQCLFSHCHHYLSLVFCLFISFVWCVYVAQRSGAGMWGTVWRSEGILPELSSLTLWVVGITLGSLGWVANAFTNWVPLLILFTLFWGSLADSGAPPTWLDWLALGSAYPRGLDLYHPWLLSRCWRSHRSMLVHCPSHLPSPQISIL